VVGGACDRERERAARGGSVGPVGLAVTGCSDCKRGWQNGGGLVTEMTPPAVERAMCDAQWIGDGPLEPRAALHEHGYDRDQVAEIMRRTIAHVGEAICRKDSGSRSQFVTQRS